MCCIQILLIQSSKPKQAFLKLLKVKNLITNLKGENCEELWRFEKEGCLVLGHCTYFLYSPSTVVLVYFSTSFMALTRSLISLDKTLCAISTWKQNWTLVPSISQHFSHLSKLMKDLYYFWTFFHIKLCALSFPIHLMLL